MISKQNDALAWIYPDLNCMYQTILKLEKMYGNCFFITSNFSIIDTFQSYSEEINDPDRYPDYKFGDIKKIPISYNYVDGFIFGNAKYSSIYRIFNYLNEPALKIFLDYYSYGAEIIVGFGNFDYAFFNKILFLKNTINKDNNCFFVSDESLVYGFREELKNNFDLIIWSCLPDWDCDYTFILISKNKCILNEVSANACSGEIKSFSLESLPKIIPCDDLEFFNQNIKKATALYVERYLGKL